MFRQLLLGSMFATSMIAFGAQGDQWLVAKGAYTQFDDKAGPKDKEGFGLGYGVWFTDHLGMDLTLLRTELHSRVPGATATGAQHQLLGSFLFGFNPTGDRFFPYLAVGLGGTETSKPFSDSHQQTIRVNYHAGLGAQFKLGEHFALTLDSKYVRNQARTVRNDWVNSVGLGVVWGNGFH